MIGRIPLLGPIAREIGRQVRVVRKRGLRTLPNYWRVRSMERDAKRKNRIQGADQVECPCCEWTGQTFHPLFLGVRTRANASCPNCGSRERHRAYSLYYQKSEQLHEFDGRLLYVAPPPCVLNSVFGQHKLKELVTSDIRPVGVTIQADLTKFPADDGSFDRILCHHVLEHILDDHAAISEIRRLLTPEGVAYIAVPQNMSLDRTEEWGKPNPRISGHVRDYGRDFSERLNAFSVECLNLSTLWGEARRMQWGLGDNELLYKCSAS